MNIVVRPELPPGFCIASLASEDPKGFIDTLLAPALPLDPRIYVSVSWVEEMAAKLGWLSPDEAGELRAECDALGGQVLDLEDELARADAALDAIDVIESRDFRARKKPGRPKRRDDLEEAA